MSFRHLVGPATCTGLDIESLKSLITVGALETLYRLEGQSLSDIMTMHIEGGFAGTCFSRWEAPPVSEMSVAEKVLADYTFQSFSA
ncbi:MAG TPA: hypothetical protein PKM17_06365 [Syntrophorhabdus sp.]|nr:hypothetical protein [Syntrophorhabdus sp.]